jgi:hypothetical protein
MLKTGVHFFTAGDFGRANFAFSAVQLRLNLFRYSTVAGQIELTSAAHILHLSS